MLTFYIFKDYLSEGVQAQGEVAAVRERERTYMGVVGRGRGRQRISGQLCGEQESHVGLDFTTLRS